MGEGPINQRTGKGKSKPVGHRPGQLKGIRARGRKGAARASTPPPRK